MPAKFIEPPFFSLYKAQAKSIKNAAAFAKKAPEDFQLGTGAWVTARFSAEHPLPTAGKNGDESYALANKNAVKPRAKKKKTPKKRSTRRVRPDAVA